MENKTFYSHNCYIFNHIDTAILWRLTFMAILFNPCFQSSILLINATCKPAVLTLQLVDMYKQLDKGKKWTLEFPLSW